MFSAVIITILVPCFLCAVSPEITFLTEGQTALAGSPINITCRVDSFPSSNITWYLDERVVNATYVIEEFLDDITQESTVTISSIAPTDIGTYRCEAVNYVSGTNMNTTLTVESKYVCREVNYIFLPSDSVYSVAFFFILYIPIFPSLSLYYVYFPLSHTSLSLSLSFCVCVCVCVCVRVRVCVCVCACV